MSTKPLSPSAQKIQDQLKSLGYDCTVIEHVESTRTAQEAADRVGCNLGQIVIPPVGHLQEMETYIDEDFLQYETIWAAAGTPNAIFELKTEDLQKMTNGKVKKVK